MTAGRGLALTVAISLVVTVVLASGVLRDRHTQLFGYELAGRHHDPFTVMAQYESGSVPPPYLQPATDLPGILLARVFGPLDAYNLLVLIAFPLTAVFAYLHARHVIGSTSGAVVAAMLFTLSPFHLAHSAYHVHVAQLQWVPLFFLLLWRLVEQPALGRALALSGSLLLAGAASFYFGFLTAVMAVPALLAYASWRVEPARARTRALAWGGGTIVAAGACVAMAIAVAMPMVFTNWRGLGFAEEALDQHSARWWSYLLPAASHPLLGPLSLGVWRSAGIDVGLLEQQVSLGIGLIALAAVQIAHAWHPGRARTRTWAMPLAITAAVAAVFSLPPALTVGPVTIPMPSQILYFLAPMFRAYARFGVIVSLMVTTLAGGGFAVLLADRVKWGRAVAVALLALAVFEYLPSRHLSRDVLPTSAHRWLAGATDARVFDCVAPTPGRTAAVSSLMGVDVRFPAGPLADCAEPGFAAKLAAFDLTHLIVRRDSPAGQWLADGGQIDGLRMAHAAPDGSVFEVAASTPQVYVTDSAGLYPREFFRADSWRWMGRTGSLTMLNSGGLPAAGSFDLDIEPFMAARQIHVRVDERLVETITATARETHSIGPVTLTPGLHTLTLESDGASVPPAAGGVTADPRQLSLRLRRWKWRAQ